ncbi:delta(3,5)-Delta(2,4)-dienoyl-CoA isomerase, mitochondrial isoform X2 [Prorops nasuta]
MPLERYTTLAVSVPKPFVYLVQLNRPDKRNALDTTMWEEFGECFNSLGSNPECRSIVLAANGKLFCAGIDLSSMMKFGEEIGKHDDIARKSKVIETFIKKYQKSLSSVEKCPKPVIAAIHGACIGAGIDMVSGVDIRYCTSDAYFVIKEVDIGMAADVGTLQRLPKAIGSQSLVRELVFTGRKFPAVEALQNGFVSKIFDTQQSLLEKAIELAEEIASKSPVAVQTSKESLNYSRDHTVQEGLDHIRWKNQAMLQSEDFLNAVMAQATKGEKPVFSKL